MDPASLPLDIPDIFGSALTFQIATAGNKQRTQPNGKKRDAVVLLDEPKSLRSIVCVGAEEAPTAHVPCTTTSYSLRTAFHGKRTPTSE